jgi:hypothetical protein
VHGRQRVEIASIRGVDTDLIIVPVTQSGIS